MDNIDLLKQKCQNNGGNWKGFRLGKDNAILVRIRRNANKNFFLIVKNVLNMENDFGSIEIFDPNGVENGTAHRYDKESFSPPS